MIPVSVIILTYNESINIGRCLDCLAWTDDVIVVDSFSTDDTLDLVRRQRPDVQIFQNPFEDFGQQRNWAIDSTLPKYEWILFVDADEFCTPELVREIGEFINNPGDYTGGFIAGENYFLGRWIRFSTYHPSYQLRLLKKDDVRFSKEGHGQREVSNGRMTYFKSGWIHEPISKGVAQWVARHNVYSTEEVDQLHSLKRQPLILKDCLTRDPIVRRRLLKRIGARLPLRPFFKFIFSYVIRGGFRDGYSGLLFCLLKMTNDIHISIKACEKKYMDKVKNQ